MPNPKVALLTMEMLLTRIGEPYCGTNFRGGLGILAGDIMARLADADIDGISFVPLYRRPWYHKDLEINYDDQDLFPAKITIQINGHRFIVREIKNHPHRFGIENAEIFDILYTENRQKRLQQEVFMGKVVPETTKQLGFKPDVIWINESHTALAIPQFREDPYFENSKILFTIHTPEQAGMEKFYDYRFDQSIVMNPDHYWSIFAQNNVIDLTWAAMVLADAVVAVSKEHADITKRLFPQFRSKIRGIINGSDARFWKSPELTEHLAKHETISEEELTAIHQNARTNAFAAVMHKSGIELDPQKPTAWFVRRLADYKNLYPMLKDILPAICAERRERVSTEFGELEGLGMQVVGAGRAPETDNNCLWWMAELTRIARDNLRGRFVFIADYSLELLRVGAWGSDVWIVTPKLGREACGTSDQRCQINGIPIISSRTGGPLEYLEEFDTKTQKGSGFFIEPYEPLALYEKMRIFSELWYAWRDHGDKSYPRLKHNAFHVGKTLDIVTMLAQYRKLFEKLIL